MESTLKTPFFVSIPHSGEQVPAEVSWLQGLPEVTLMRDVDRFVDKLYQESLQQLAIPSIVTPWHRYVVDLNRKPDQYDATAVLGATEPAGQFSRGLHWSVTTHKEVLIPQPMSQELHEQLVEKYYKPFHESVQGMRKTMKQQLGVVYHLDLHSMPSVGTELHSDPGETRAEVVVSDFHGASAEPFYRDLVMESYQKAGFQVAYNWPYVGGGITQMYGEPASGFHTIQVELNRAQYMDETSKKLDPVKSSAMQKKLHKALQGVQQGLQEKANG